MIKDMTLFFIAYTLIAFILGQWFTVTIPYKSDVWWYPTYLLIVILIIKVVADAFTSSGKSKKEEKKK